MEGGNIHLIYPKVGSSSPPQRSCRACEKIRADEYFERERQIKAGLLPAKQKRSKTHCLRGHEMTGDNVMLNANGRGRVCRECHTESAARHHQKKREERATAIVERLDLRNKLAGMIDSGASNDVLLLELKKVLQ